MGRKKKNQQDNEINIKEELVKNAREIKEKEEKKDAIILETGNAENQDEIQTADVPERGEPIDFNVYEASRYFGVSEQAIHLWIQHGHLKFNERRNITIESAQKWKNGLESLKNRG